MFGSSFKVACAERQSEVGHGNRMQAVWRPDDAGDGDQAAAWRPRLPRNPLARRVLRDMQGEHANREPRCHATIDRDKWPTAPKPQRIFANVVAPRACPIRRCRMGVVRYSRPVAGYGSGISNDTAPTTVPLRQATLEWPGTEETCPKCHGQ